jgi:preflagellin peptidase FlaK
MIPEIPTIYLDIIRTLLGVLLFGLAAKHDMADRDIPNYIWNILVIGGALMFSAQILSSTTPLQLISHYVANIVLAIIVGWSLYLGGQFGGADAKAITSIAVLFPALPNLGTFSFMDSVYSVAVYMPSAAPPYDIVLPATIITFLANTAIFGAYFPARLGYRSLRDGVDRSQTINSLLGDKIGLDELESHHGKIVDARIYQKAPESSIMQYLKCSRHGLPTIFIQDYLEWHRDKYDSDATVSTVDRWRLRQFVADYNENHKYTYELEFEHNALADSVEDVENTLASLQEQEYVFVTPSFPFIVPMFFGVLSMVTIGDIAFATLTLLN